MIPEIVSIHRNGEPRKEGMLFVRTDGILETMVKAPLLLAGLLIVAISMPLQPSFSSIRSLDLIVYSDGTTHVTSQIDVDPLEPIFEVNLFGPSVDNFVAVGENGFLLSSEIIIDQATIDTFGSSNITIDYDVHDLVSKEGRVWTFSFDSQFDYTLLMPENSVIVGMSALPNNMEIINDQTKLELPTGPAEINYIFGTSTDLPTPIPSESESSLKIENVGIVGGIIAAGIIGSIIAIKSRSKQTPPPQSQTISEKLTESKSLDPETIFNLRPEMREDDKEIVKFISENGGEALESELRKKFLQPRTTMWRAVKRLERLGVIEIQKKEMQNLVKLRKELEDEE